MSPGFSPLEFCVLNVRETLVNALLADKVDTVFCLMGDTIQNLMGDLAARPDVRLVHGRHESSVVSMADGYSRFSRHIGCAAVTAGPGLTNTATALAVARAHRSPVLLLAGAMPARRGNDVDQQAFGRLTAGMASTVDRPADLPEHWHSLQRALADNQPYVLSLPTDIQESAYEELDGLEPLETGTVPCIPTAAVKEAVDVLTGAHRLGIVAGRGALVSGAGPALLDLAARLGAVLSTTLLAHGLFAGHPADVGMVGGLGNGLANRALESCDAILAVGTSLGPMVRTWLPDHARLVVVDAAPPPTIGGRENELWIKADAAAALSTVNQLLSDLQAHPIDRPVDGLLRNVTPTDPSPWQDTATTVDPRHALDEIARSLPTDCGVVLGGGHAALNSSQALRA
jgi:thiamine pyrophosphate-dependent acetolactate synthase large subunit-like protein